MLLHLSLSLSLSFSISQTLIHTYIFWEKNPNPKQETKPNETKTIKERLIPWSCKRTKKAMKDEIESDRNCSYYT